MDLDSKEGRAATVAEVPVAVNSSTGGALPIASVTELVYRRLQSRIVAGMPPGEPLRLNDLAAEFGVSTTPVRMAIERLAADGLATQRSRKGASVAPLSLPDLRDIYAVRRGLEGTAARLGVPLLTASDQSTMLTQLRQLDRGMRGRHPDVDVYLRGEWEIHLICYRAPGHRRLLEEIQGYRRQAERYLRLVLLQEANFRDDLEHQRAFVDACRNGDAIQAEGLAVAMLDWTVERVGSLIDSLPMAERKDAASRAYQ